MKQYLEALRGREDISEEILLELEERFKDVEEEIIDIPIITLEERLELAEEMLMMILMGGM